MREQIQVRESDYPHHHLTDDGNRNHTVYTTIHTITTTIKTITTSIHTSLLQRTPLQTQGDKRQAVPVLRDVYAKVQKSWRRHHQYVQHPWFIRQLPEVEPKGGELDAEQSQQIRTE
jgi:hypothetical protein